MSIPTTSKLVSLPVDFTRAREVLETLLNEGSVFEEDPTHQVLATLALGIFVIYCEMAQVTPTAEGCVKGTEQLLQYAAFLTVPNTTTAVN